MGKAVIPNDQRDLGPAMLALTPLQRGFVLARVFGGLNFTESARHAGYSSTSHKGLGVIGHNLYHRADIQAAIREETSKLMASEGANSIRTLVEVRDDKEVRSADRVKAALALLDRSGFHKISESIQHVEHHLTDHQKDARILALCAELGIPKQEAAKMLVAPSENVIDAAYEEVTPPPELTEEEKKKKTERDRENEQRRQWYRMTPEEKAARKIALREAASERAKAARRNYQQQENGDIPDAGSQPVVELPDDLSDIL